MRPSLLYLCVPLAIVPWMVSAFPGPSAAPKGTPPIASTNIHLKVNPLPSGIIYASALVGSKPATNSLPIPPGLASSVRAFAADEETWRSLSPAQRDALKRLERQFGGKARLRLRSVGTPRLLELPSAASATTPQAVSAPPAMVVERFLSDYRTLLLLTDPKLELALAQQQTDDLGYTHFKFSQVYQGLPVWPAELVVHLSPAGRVDSLNGSFVPTPALAVLAPSTGAAQAIDVARSALGAPDTPTTPPTLILYAPMEAVPRLAWRFEVNAAAHQRWTAVVDAQSGAFLNAYSLIMDGNVQGSGLDLKNVRRPLNVWQQGTTNFLVDTSKPMFNPASTPPSQAKGALMVADARHQVLSASNQITLYHITSTSTTSGWLPDGVSAAFGLSETYDYYRVRHGRQALDGQGTTMMAIVRYGQSYQNAFWNGQAMFFGDGSPFAAAEDVLAHELTHGVVSYTANLVYQNQSGALNEALADIFGAMVQAWTQGTNNWLMGEDLGKPGRSLADPGSIEFISGHKFPSKMSEIIGPNDPILDNLVNRDQGGVHINSTIISHAFYHLVAGLPQPLHATNAANIFYRALTTHLVAQSDFLDCRLACVKSAQELFGQTSAEAARTGEAFDAVELFDGATPPSGPTNPVVTGPDSALFVYYEPFYGGSYLARREDARGDPSYGTTLSIVEVASRRPSVSGDGSFGVFVSATHDMCFIPTDGSRTEQFLGYPGTIRSVAMAPDGNHYGFVLQSAAGQPQNVIQYFDLTGAGTNYSIRLEAPSDAGPVGSVRYADTMCFTPDNRYLVYDALNLLQLNDGTTVEVWSIYAYDVLTGRTLALVPPVPDRDIGNPYVGHTGNNLMTFEVYDPKTDTVLVYVSDLASGSNRPIASVQGLLAWPCYNGDDTAITYTQLDANTPTGSSLTRQTLAADHLTPSGAAVKWVEDGECGFVYRRGAYTPPAPVAQADLRLKLECSTTSVPLTSNFTFTASVSNAGPAQATAVTLVNTLPTNTAFVTGALSQGTGSHTAGKVTCNFGNIAAGARATATIVVLATGTGLAFNSASVVAAQEDPAPADNNASASTTVTGTTVTATLIVVASPSEGGTVMGGGVFPVGSQQVISATPNPGWFFGQWQDGNSQTPRTVTVPAGGAKFTAYFTNGAPQIVRFTNGTSIVINDETTASPYPSVISVSGQSGPVRGATVTLRGFSHVWPHDVAALLVGPAGQSVVLLADAGAGAAVSGIELTFDDLAATALTETAPILAGSYKPSNCATAAHSFPSPAPAGAYGAALQGFVGTEPNGPWSLYVLDDQPSDSGRVDQGWVLALSLPAATGPVLTLRSAQFRPDGHFSFDILAPAGTNYEIRVSADLKTWKQLAVVTLTGTTVTNFVDPNLNLQQRFYRVRRFPE